MKKLIHNIHKEILILTRDLAGLAILFLMPLLLIIVVTLTQEEAIRSVNGGQIEILFFNNDSGEIGKSIKNGLISSGEIVFVEGAKINENDIQKLVASGVYSAGIVIPENTTEASKERILADLQAVVDGEKSNLEDISIHEVHIYYDPAIRDVIRRTLSNAIHSALSSAESSLMINVLFDKLPEIIQTDDPASIEILQALQEVDAEGLSKSIIPLDEGFAGGTDGVIKPSMTQNNVPAFSLFAMFFIVIPLAGSLIAEKNEGTYQRLRTVPVTYLNLLMGKTIAYIIVCFLQFFLMVFVGVVLFPLLFDLPQLEIGSQYAAIFVATLVSALSAIGFGILVGTFSSSHNQAAMFGAIIVVIMASLGGIFMPVYMMPDNLKIISILSPLRWGIDSYLDIFVRGAGLDVIWKNLLLLTGFFALSVGIALRRF